jgi:hypothetical protein
MKIGTKNGPGEFINATAVDKVRNSAGSASADFKSAAVALKKMPGE